MNKEVKLSFKSLINGFVSFILFAYVAMLLNIIIYNIGILNGETFNMFYISPYFISHLPVFNTLQQKLPYIIYLITYIIIIFAGAIVIYLINKVINKITKKDC